MINYTEKGIGLHLAIAKAGYVFKQENGIFVSDNDTQVQLIIDGYTLSNAQIDKSANVDKYAETKFDKAVLGVSPAEMSGWSILRAEQAKYELSLNTADCPSIVAEAAVRGITVDVLAAKVKANATKFNFLRASIAGTSGKHRDAIKALTTFDDISAYDFTTGWMI